MTTSYLSAAQVEQLLKPIHPSRVSVRDGLSHLEAYDVRAHLNRIFGFGRWSADLIDLHQIYEVPDTTSAGKPAFSVGYRATVRLTVCAPDGTVLATYTEAATGDAKMPDFKRGDTHDFAIKTAESQALKRCVTNLGDQFGLSLYQKGSRDPLVKATLVGADVPSEPVDAHVIPVTPEHGGEEQPDTTHAVSGQATPPASSGTLSPEEPAPAAPTDSPDGAARQEAKDALAKQLRDRAIEITKTESKTRALQLLTKVNFDAGKNRLMTAQVRAENGEQMTLGVLIDQLIKGLSRTPAAVNS